MKYLSVDGTACEERLKLHQTGRTAEGMDFIRRAIGEDPRAVQFHLNLANVYGESGQALECHPCGLAFTFAREHRKPERLRLPRGDVESGVVSVPEPSI